MCRSLLVASVLALLAGCSEPGSEVSETTPNDKRAETDPPPANLPPADKEAAPVKHPAKKPAAAPAEDFCMVTVRARYSRELYRRPFRKNDRIDGEETVLECRLEVLEEIKGTCEWVAFRTERLTHHFTPGKTYTLRIRCRRNSNVLEDADVEILKEEP
jgi:hypothetical protein